MAFFVPPGIMMEEEFFTIWQKRGYHVTPNHFYYPIPDTRTLKDNLWSKLSELVGIKLNENNQLELLSVFNSGFKEEYEKFPREKTEIPYQYYENNVMFRSVDAEILFCFVRHLKPGKIFEIGSGYTTCLTAEAVRKNKELYGQECELIAFEPFPNDVLKTGFPGLSALVSKPVQDINLSKFNELKENDILFIDSSHVLKIGSDVQYIYLEILPRLGKGVAVHFHDIFLPAEYPKEWVMNQSRFWTEQYLLQALLAFNDSFDVLWAGSYMHLKHPDKLESAFSSYNRTEEWPSSFWIRKIK